MSVTARLPDGRERIFNFRQGTPVGAAESRIRGACFVRGGLITNPDGIIMLPDELLQPETVYLFSDCEGQFISFADLLPSLRF